MPRVCIDGENVEFDGDAPQTCGAACELIEGFLSGQGLTIESILVDGEALPIEEAFVREAYELIEFKSISPQGQLLAMCRQWESDCSELAGEMAVLGERVLRIGWSESQSTVIAFLEKLRPLIEGLGVLQNFGTESAATWGESVTNRLGAALASIDVVVDAVESRDCVALSDRLANEMASSWGAVVVTLGTEVIPTLGGDAAV